MSTLLVRAMGANAPMAELPVYRMVPDMLNEKMCDLLVLICALRVFLGSVLNGGPPRFVTYWLITRWSLQLARKCPWPVSYVGYTGVVVFRYTSTGTGY